jgi:hypothetical protein
MFSAKAEIAEPLKSLRQIRIRYERNMESALQAAGDYLLVKSQELVPVDTGALKGSGSSHQAPESQSGFGTVWIVGYGRGLAGYEQHGEVVSYQAKAYSSGVKERKFSRTIPEEGGAVIHGRGGRTRVPMGRSGGSEVKESGPISGKEYPKGGTGQYVHTGAGVSRIGVSGYAVFVHQDLTAHHEVGQAKFLERPARERRPEMAKIVLEEMRKDAPTKRLGPQSKLPLPDIYPHQARAKEHPLSVNAMAHYAKEQEELHRNVGMERVHATQARMLAGGVSGKLRFITGHQFGGERGREWHQLTGAARGRGRGQQALEQAGHAQPLAPYRSREGRRLARSMEQAVRMKREQERSHAWIEQWYQNSGRAESIGPRSGRPQSAAQRASDTRAAARLRSLGL